MTKKTNANISEILSDIAVSGLQEKKGNEIVRLDLRPIKGAITDFFVICHADSNAQIHALAKSVEDEIFKSTKINPWKKEGFEQGEWIILDYLDIVVHIFRTDKREYYGIEDLWGDAKTQTYQSA